MQFFFLHEDPKTSAQMICDLHLNMSLLDACLMMCTTLHLWKKAHLMTKPYNQTHKSHLLVHWCAASVWHFRLVFRHALAIATEYEIRYKRTHACFDVLLDLQVNVLTALQDETRCSASEFVEALRLERGTEYAEDASTKICKLSNTAETNVEFGILLIGVEGMSKSLKVLLLERIFISTRSDFLDSSYRDLYAIKCFIGFRPRKKTDGRRPLTWRHDTDVPEPLHAHIQYARFVLLANAQLCPILNNENLLRNAIDLQHRIELEENEKELERALKLPRLSLESSLVNF